MTRRYAEGTKVSVERSKAEIEKLLTSHKAEQVGLVADHAQGLTVLMCKLGGRLIRFEVWTPDPAQFEQTPAGQWRNAEAQAKAVQAELRRRWRALLLILKAKLEAIASGDSTIDGEFLAHVLLPNGQTVQQAMAPGLDAAYASGKMPTIPLLPEKDHQ